MELRLSKTIIVDIARINQKNIRVIMIHLNVRTLSKEKNIQFYNIFYFKSSKSTPIYNIILLLKANYIYKNLVIKTFSFFNVKFYVIK